MSTQDREYKTREIEMIFRSEADKIVDCLLNTKSTYGEVEDSIKSLKSVAERKGYKSTGVYELALQTLRFKMRTTLIESGSDSERT